MSLAEHWNARLRARPEDGPDVPAWVTDLRAKGAAAFEKHGLPHRKTEDWKYTSLKLLEARSHDLAAQDRNTHESIAWPSPVAGKNAASLKFVNGQLQAGFEAPEGVEIQDLQQALADPDHVKELRGILESLPLDGPALAFSALNTSLLHNGVVIRVPAGTAGGTLLLQWSFDDTPPAMMFNSRVIIVLEEGASLTLVEQFESENSQAHALNLVTQARVGRNAALSQVRIQAEWADASLITRTDCEVLDGGTFEASAFDWGAGWTRHDSQVRLMGDGAQGTVNGAFILDGEQHLDHHVFIDHVSGGTSSNQFFRGVLSGSSRGVFNGKARIVEGADGSSIRQSNANLLLSPMAEIDTKPELEIYADEVEASHGATVGQLDDDSVFYLRSRGLSEDAARALLTSAFCKAVLDQSPGISDALGDEIANRIEGALVTQAGSRPAPG